jgi:hypothetical protein
MYQEEDQIANEEEIEAQVNLEVDQEEAMDAITPRSKRIRSRPKWQTGFVMTMVKPNKK